MVIRDPDGRATPRLPLAVARRLGRLITRRPVARRPRVARRRAHGQSLVEFALVFPLFVLLVGGMIQFGVIFWGQNTLNQVVRDTGRYASTRDCSAVAKSDSETRFGQILLATGGPWKAPSVAVTYSSASCPVDNQGDVWVNVTASVDAPIFFIWVPGNGRLTSATDFRVEPQP